MKIEAPTRDGGAGIWVAQALVAGGYGTDAVRTLCRFGFDHVNLHRIRLYVNADNTQAIGGLREGGVRARRPPPGGGLRPRGRVDLLVMGLLAAN